MWYAYSYDTMHLVMLCVVMSETTVSCRDSKGADYASKGWPPADGGKLVRLYLSSVYFYII